MYGVEISKPAPGNDKQMRLHAESIKFKSGKIFLPTTAVWGDEYVREITGFPGVKFDDQVDSTTQALEYLGNKGRKAEVWAILGRS